MDTGCIPPTVNFFQYTSEFFASRTKTKIFSNHVLRTVEWLIFGA
ncbi:DUF1661 domain-containing protein [Porphyromonas gingivalis]